MTNLNTIIKELEKKYGEGTVFKFSDKKRVDIETIPTGSISLDYALGIGGIPRGRIIEIFGPESSGKTTLALSIIAQAQKQGLKCAFIDAEHSLDPDYAENIGVKLDQIVISQPNSGEQALDIVESFVRSGEIGLIVVDSVAALTPQAEIDGVMGQMHIGLQARLMSQALRKLTAIASKSKTTILFVNQIRMMIGIKWGCVHSNTYVHTSNGKKLARKIQKNDSLVSLNLNTNTFEDTKVDAIFDNGRASDRKDFIKLKIQSKDNNLYQIVVLTKNHKVLTKEKWKEADKLTVNDRLVSWVNSDISKKQEQIIIGSLFGDGQITQRSLNSLSYQLILRNSTQPEYLSWKIKNLNCFKFIKKRKTNYFSEWYEKIQYFYEHFYRNANAEKNKLISEKRYRIPSDEIIKNADILAFAVWYMDDGSFSLKKNKYVQNNRTATISVKRIKEQPVIKKIIKRMKNLGWTGISFDQEGIYFDKTSFTKFSEDIKRYVIPEMQYKLLPEHRNQYEFEILNKRQSIRIPIYLNYLDSLEISNKEAQSLKKIDFKTDCLTYMVGSSAKTNGIVIHNSPETTSGGTALKFYTSVRIEIRRAAKLKKEEEIIGNRVKVKVAKNKLAAPFKMTEFDIIFNKGISYEGDVLSFGIKKEVIKKEGISLVFENEKLGRGLESSKVFLEAHPEIVEKIVKAIKEKDDAE